MSARSTRGLAAAALAMVVVTSACSSSGDVSSPSTTSAGAATTAAPATTTAVSAGEAGFTFGFLAPGPGLTDELAVAQRRSLDLAVSEINAAGGVLGKPVRAVTVTQAADTPVTASVQQLLDQGANVILGPVGSADTVAVLPTLSGSKAIACSASATQTTLTTKATEGSFFRTALPDDQTVAFAADKIAKQLDALDPKPAGKPVVTVLARDDSYGNDISGGLAGALTARDVEVKIVAYNPRRVIFTDEVARVVATKPNLVVLAAFEEAPRQLDTLIGAGVKPAQIVGLDGAFTPRLGEQTFPGKPEGLDGITLLGSTGDRSWIERLIGQPGQQQIVYGAQLYDCAIVSALAAIAAKSAEPANFGPQMIPVSKDGRTCSTYADCVAKLSAGEDINYDGPSGGIAFDPSGDTTTARFTDATFEQGKIKERSSEEIDLVAQRQAEAIAAGVFTVQLQQALTLLGHFEGPITGVYDEATIAAVKSFQTKEGLEVNGIYDEATDAALRGKLGAGATALTTSTSELQQALIDLGYYKGPVDGRYSAALVAAVKALQTDLGVTPTGLIDVATLQAAFAKGVSSVPTTVEPPASTVAPETTVAPAPTEPPAPPTTVAPQPDLFDALKADPKYSTFVELLVLAGYSADLGDPRSFTVFAPTNDAFAALPAETIDKLKADPAALSAVLAYHVVPGRLASVDLTSTSLNTLYGASVKITVGGGKVTVNESNVVDPDHAATNGIYHGIDAVLTAPPVPKA